jgi:DNA-binding winged helix-turn-helix (wHTH) protein
MGNGTRLLFNPFVLDMSNQSLKRSTEKIVLKPKTVAVFDFLARNPHRLVKKTEIKAAFWPGVKVVDAALRVGIQEKNQGATSIPDPGWISLTGLSRQSNVVECQDDNSLRH